MNSNFKENRQQKVNDARAGVSGDVVANFVASSPIDPKLAGGFDLTDDDITEIVAYDEQSQPSRHKAAFDAWQGKHRSDIERNQRSGHIAQALDAIDEHRKTPEGRADYNANRREKRRKDAVAEGRTIKPRKHYETTDESAQAHAGAKQAYKDRQKIEFALMSPDEQQALRDEQARKKREQRKRRKAEAAKALADKAIF